MKLTLLGALVCASLTPAFAASPWDGTWKLDRAKSHLTGDSFTYSKLPDGKWLITAGQIKISFAPDGKSYPILDADHTMTATMNGDHGITFVNQFKGKTTSTMKETLSADGKTLTDETSGVQPDGSSYTSTEVSTRSGAGTGFLGKWVSTKESSTSKGIIVISTAPDGAMTWTYPSSKESFTTRFDGKPSPITGPQVFKAFHLNYTKIKYDLRFEVSLDDKKIAEGFDNIAADGKSFTETSWAPGQESEKTTAYYAKQ